MILMLGMDSQVSKTSVFHPIYVDDTHVIDSELNIDSVVYSFY